MIIARVVFTRILRSRRTWALAMLPALGVLIGVIAMNANESPQQAYGHYVRNLVIPIVLALVALVIATSAIGDERDELTILYVAQTPVTRARIVVEVWLSALAATLLLVAPPLVTALVLARDAALGAGALLDVVVVVILAGAAYCAVGVLLALLTRRAALIGLVYVLLWEGTMSGFAAGARNLSIAQHARAIVARSVDPLTRSAIKPPTIDAGVSLVVLIVATAAMLHLARRRLQRMNLP